MADHRQNLIDTPARRNQPEAGAALSAPGIVGVDAHARIVSWNPAAGMMLAAAGDLLAPGRPFAMLEQAAMDRCGVTFTCHGMADETHVCLRMPSAPVASPPVTPTAERSLDVLASSFAFLHNPLPLWVFDRETLAFLAVNDAAVERYGYSRERFLTMRLTDIREYREVRRFLDAVRDDPPGGNYGEWRHRLSDGTVIDVLVSVEWFCPDGRTLGLAAIQDITDHCRLEDRLVQAKLEAERADRARSRFFSVANHDLRQPLAALSLFVGALENRLKDPTSRDILRAMTSALLTIKNLVDAHLDIARIDAGTLRVDPVSHSVNGLLTRMALEFAPQARQKGLTLHVSPCSAVIRSDRDLLERILRNLLSNAVRYTARGRVLLGCRRRGDNLRLEVWDTGPGIPPDQLDIIFEEFYRGSASPASESAGFGLGLSIVDRLSRLLDHPLSVRSAEGKGSVFAIDVPMAAEAEEASAPPPLPMREADVSRARVLVIEDDVIVLQALELLLSQWGCEVVAASGYDEAVDCVSGQPQPPDLVIADFRLSGPASGIVAIRLIAKLLGADLPGLIITGDTDPRRLREARLSGYPLLHKPVSALALRAAVASLLGRDRLRDSVS